MIKFVYVPEALDTPFGSLSDPSPVQEMTMTLSRDVSWEEATTEFHNFLRGAGYVIPYDSEDDVGYIDCSDPPDMDKSGSLGDRQPEWANRMGVDDNDFNSYPLAANYKEVMAEEKNT